MLTDRQKLILKAIIEEYVTSNEPVGSKMLTEKPYLDFSSATLRYEMQHLEETGYLLKTHTSSGRIPSEIGYKYYIDHLIIRDNNVTEFYKYIDSILDDKLTSRSEKIKKITEFLSDLTSYFSAIITSPNEQAKVLRLEIVPLTEKEAILLIVTSTGDVQSEIIEIPNNYKMDDLLRIIGMFDTAMYGHSIYEIRDILSNEASKPRIRQMVDFRDDILNFMIKAFEGFLQGEMVSTGLSKLLNQPEFQDSKKMQCVIKAIEKDILSNFGDKRSSGIQIHIGRENLIEGFEECSVIMMPFNVGDNENGLIYVIGPLRMNYRAVIPLLEYIGKSMNKLNKG